MTEQKKARFNKETDNLHKKWGKILFNDPYYNPNLTMEKEDMSLKI